MSTLFRNQCILKFYHVVLQKCLKTIASDVAHKIFILLSVWKYYDVAYILISLYFFSESDFMETLVYSFYLYMNYTLFLNIWIVH